MIDKGVRPIRPEDRGWDRVEVDKRVQKLQQIPGVRVLPCPRNLGAIEYEIYFLFTGSSKVMINLLIADWQSTSELVIARMGTSHQSRSQGFGGRALTLLIDWAREDGWKEIRATQVSRERSAKFWKRYGFISCPKPNPTGDYVLKLTVG